MKKLLAILLALALTAALAACAKTEKPAQEQQPPAPETPAAEVQVQAQEPLQPGGNDEKEPAETPESAGQKQGEAGSEENAESEELPAAALGVYASKAKTEGRAEDDEQTLVYSISYERLSLETAEPEKLAQALADLNEGTRVYAEQNRDQTIARANARYAEQKAALGEPAEGEPEPAPVSLDFEAVQEERELFVTRADTRILSAAERITYRTQGAEPVVRYSAVNIASETGERLAAGMVFRDLDALARTVGERLEEKYPGAALDTIKDGLAAKLKENAACWTLGSEGAVFYFSDADGRLLTATVFYGGDAELFEPYYGECAESRAEPLFTGEVFDADLDGDGEREPLNIKLMPSDDDGADKLTFFMEEDKGRTFRFFGDRYEAYYVVSGGERYVYVNGFAGDDWGWTEVYGFEDGVPEYVGEVEDSARDAARCRIIAGRSLMTDPQRFAMGRNVDLVGGFAAIRFYRVGEDGLPAPLDTMFNSDGESTLTLARDLEVQGITGKKITLRAQTKLMLLSTDGVWRIDVSDGQGIYSIFDTLSASGEYVNGISAKEVFAELAPAQTETETAG